MPIKKENKARYPKNWKQLSEFIRFERAKNHCEVCGVENYSNGYWIENKFVTVSELINQLEETGETQIDNFAIDKKPIRIILTVAHLDHIPEHCDLINLKAMCQRCHNRYDIEHRKFTRLNNKNQGVLLINFFE